MTEQQQAAMRQALEALSASDDFLFNYHDCEPNNEREVDAYSEVRGNNMKAWEAIREALAEQQSCYCPNCEALGKELQRLRALVRAQQITIDKLEAQQEPVAWVVEDNDGERLEWAGDVHSVGGLPTFPLYTSPPASKPWVGLTDEDLQCFDADAVNTARYWEAKLREKNGGAA